MVVTVSSLLSKLVVLGGLRGANALAQMSSKQPVQLDYLCPKGIATVGIIQVHLSVRARTCSQIGEIGSG